MRLMSELDLSGRRVLIREDLNVPLRDSEITNDARLRAAAPSILAALEQGAAVIVMSHLGRPTEGEWSEEASMAPIARRLAELIGRDVLLATEWRQVAPLPGDVVLLENVRFNIGEAADDASLSADYASLCDVFVMDAFGTAHRAQASTHGVVHSAPVACAGPLLHAELTALERALTGAQKPMLAVVGGSKVSTKLEVLDQLSKQCDSLVVGGGIANTFLAAAGYPVGQSLCEWDLIETARRLMRPVSGSHSHMSTWLSTSMSVSRFSACDSSCAPRTPPRDTSAGSARARVHALAATPQATSRAERRSGEGAACINAAARRVCCATSTRAEAGRSTATTTPLMPLTTGTSMAAGCTFVPRAWRRSRVRQVPCTSLPTSLPRRAAWACKVNLDSA